MRTCWDCDFQVHLICWLSFEKCFGLTSTLYFAQNALHQLSKEFTQAIQIMAKILQLVNMMSFQPGCSRVCVSSTITDCIVVLLLARGVLVTLLNMKLKAANYFRKTFPLKYLPGTQIHKYQSAMPFLYFPAGIYLLKVNNKNTRIPY